MFQLPPRAEYFSAEHEAFRASVRRFVEAAVVVVGAAQDPLVLGLLRARVGEADVGAQRDPLAPRVEVVARIFELVRPAERRRWPAMGLRPGPQRRSHSPRCRQGDIAAVSP